VRRVGEGDAGQLGRSRLEVERGEVRGARGDGAADAVGEGPGGLAVARVDAGVDVDGAVVTAGGLVGPDPHATTRAAIAAHARPVFDLLRTTSPPCRPELD
jgi:hypothetical protein